MASQYHPRRILVVDDNRESADLTAELLSMYGHVATAAYGGQDGIQAAIDFVPDVILLDLGMPVLDGFAVAEALRQMPAMSQLSLIAYTAWSDAETRARVRNSGFSQHIVKPARLETILDTVAGISLPTIARPVTQS